MMHPITKAQLRSAGAYFGGFAASATTEQIARFIDALNNRGVISSPVILTSLTRRANRELIARTKWSV